jgi:UDP-N-acetylglucosamine/UDP-N-acetyl-alpha-D-glucosaminouronate 4-epimerase
MHALVTGGGGFIGSHLVDALLAAGVKTRVLDNFATGRRANLAHVAGEIEIVEGDIQSYERVSKAVKGCDAVFHQAALPSVPRSIQDPLTSNATNVIGTLNVLLAARDHDVRRVVYASSSSVYGATPQLPKHEDLPAVPISPYASAKLAGEHYARSFHHVYGLETVALRYFNVFGPRQDPLSEYAAVIPRFVTCLAAGEPPIIYGNGEQSRDFTYVENVTRANLLAISSDMGAGRVYNIACGEQITLNRLLEALQETIGSDVKATHAAPRPGDVKHSVADISRARAELGYRPAVGFHDGLARTVAAMLSEPADTRAQRGVTASV